MQCDWTISEAWNDQEKKKNIGLMCTYRYYRKTCMEHRYFLCVVAPMICVLPETIAYTYTLLCLGARTFLSLSLSLSLSLALSVSLLSLSEVHIFRCYLHITQTAELDANILGGQISQSVSLVLCWYCICVFWKLHGSFFWHCVYPIIYE